MVSNGQIVAFFALYLIMLLVLTIIYVLTDVEFSESMERDILMHFNDTVRLLIK